MTSDWSTYSSAPMAAVRAICWKPWGCSPRLQMERSTTRVSSLAECVPGFPDSTSPRFPQNLAGRFPLICFLGARSARAKYEVSLHNPLNDPAPAWRFKSELWARQSTEEGDGSVSGSAALSFHDVLIVHVDADVAGKTYRSASIHDPPFQDLPCQQPCPPPSATSNPLRVVILRWLGEARCPSHVVLCTPSKSIETWVIAAVCPNNRMVCRGDWECHQDPEGQLRALPKRQRFEKAIRDYRDRQHQITLAWPNLSATLTEAARFETEFLAALP